MLGDFCLFWKLPNTLAFRAFIWENPLIPIHPDILSDFLSPFKFSS